MEWVVVQEEWTAVVVTEVVITAVMDSVKMARNRTTEAIETKTDLRIRELLESLNIVSSYFAVKSFFPFAYMMIHLYDSSLYVSLPNSVTLPL